jgi:SAM-dependent methyltransferase
VTQAESPAHPSDDDWDRHWDDFSAANESNPAQGYRRRLTLHLLGRHSLPIRLLDVGAGQGDLLSAAGERWPSARLAGVEISPEGVRRAQTKVPSADLQIRDLLDGAPPPERLAGWATHAACSEVLEHVDDATGLLRAARAWMAPGCRLVVTVPGGPMSAFDRHIGHRRHFSPADLRAVLTDAGYDVALTSGAGFPFFNLYRCAVIARGDRLVADAIAGSVDETPKLALRFAMRGFDVAFRLNLPRTPLGWQIVAVAVAPGTTSSRVPAEYSRPLRESASNEEGTGVSRR